MVTITEDYVSFETAKLLKKKGFNEFCDNAYISENHIVYRYSNNDEMTAICSAPTLQMTMKWLREVHGIHLNIIYNKICDKGYWGKGHWTWNNEEYSSYEEACETAIKYCLENLI